MALGGDRVFGLERDAGENASGRNWGYIGLCLNAKWRSAVRRETVSSIDDLIETAEILRDAVLAKDKDKGFEAVTVFLMQFMGAFGSSQNMVTKMFPVVEGLKDHILSGDFEKADPVAMALLANLRMAKKSIGQS
jgi:hypothetical protein